MSLTFIERMALHEDDPGIAPDRYRPSRTQAQARTQTAGSPLPWCSTCELLGHTNTTCPKRQ